MDSVLAAVMPKPGAAVELREFPVRELEAEAAWLELTWSEVCGTDVHLLDGKLEGVPYPLIAGHVSVGRLGKSHGPVHDVSGRELQEGECITFLDVHGSCNQCWYCLVAKASTRCPKRKVYGITYGSEDYLAGGWAERLYLKPGTKLVAMGDADPKLFMAGGCGLPTALHAIERADIGIGDSVLILGAGPVGLSALILARMRGASSVLLIGAPEQRLETAAQLGASHILDFRQLNEHERLDWVKQHSQGRGVDVCIEACGDPEAVVQAMRFTRDAGRVVVVGQYTDRGSCSFNPHSDLNKKHLEIRACWGSDFSHFYKSVQILQNAELAEPWSRIPLSEYFLDEANEALADVRAGRVVKALIKSTTRARKEQ